MFCLLGRAWNMNKLKGYAQIKQDLLAFDFFRLHPAFHRVFLDVGAFDGMGFSNSRLFFEKGWSGVCVEPVLKNYRKLESLYENTNVMTIRAAATDYEGELELNVATIPWAEDWGSDVSSSTDDALERWPDYVWEKETVPAMTANSILEKNKVERVDFVSIDVEGHEMAVLRGFDLQKYKPQLLVVEYSSPEERKDLIRYMKFQGYALWIDNGQDIFFVIKLALNSWRVFLYGIYRQLSMSTLRRYIIEFRRKFAK
jgi:FkbM family methyltransferase